MLGYLREVWYQLVNWLLVKRCLWLHRKDSVLLPLYRQGTMIKIGDALFCKRCLKQ